MSVTTYHPGTSWLHAVPAGPKLLGLALAVTGVLLTSHVAVVGTELAITALLYPATRMPFRLLWRNTRVLLPFLALVVAFQLLTATWQKSLVIGGQLLIVVLLAGLVTATTKVSTMLVLFERLARPLARVGVSPRRVALVLALTIRCIPLVASAWHTSSDAYRARGMRRTSWRVVVPVIVRLLRSAEALGEAITARGVAVDQPVSRHDQR
ncbi:energy-coupling factor transporter transmembrane component T family protein [Goodfellowiella coeruleoviolacea]|uniref:Biotin transport system permease protein n=1 Tax=Goodfellowiella coeruleoviolacea TaxID=334858 RepID=A0AAE3KP37_9PSEU|nr:energy-coupling factor transporter transmembrane protein EcfT [Goodfellowiella coeruleoviolacea]MCP2169403.1 biotin transport system permease protein [Goodfellowiella coeruleoviolacea]